MHKSRLAALVIDSLVEDIEQANRFWAAALGMPVIRTNEAWADRYACLSTPDNQPNVLIHRVVHPSKIHLDIETDNIEAEVARLIALGAKKVQHFERWVVMQAPTGHNFCVVSPQRPDFDTSDEVNHWD